MKRKAIIFIALFLLGIVKVKADTMTSTISGTKQVYINGSFCNYIKVSADTPIANFNYNLSYDTSKLTFLPSKSSSLNTMITAQNNNTYSKSLTFCFVAKQLGKASINFTINGAASMNLQYYNLGKSSIYQTISIIKPRELSANANLANLGIENASLNPAFNKNTLSYQVELPPFTENIVVNGTTEDNRAKISGLGSIKVEDGENTIKVTVTAENGTTKEYIIKANVKEAEPINVVIDKEKYSLIRKEKNMPTTLPIFEKTTIKYNDIDLPAYINKTTKLTLVGIKDEKGNSKLAIYENKKFLTFNLQTFKALNLLILDQVVPNADIKTITINKEKVKVYQKENDDYYYYFKAKNMDTNKINLYRYDKEENTVQQVKNIINN